MNLKKWYNRPLRVMDLALEDPDGIWLDRWSPEELIQTVVATNANVLNMMVINEWGQTYFNSAYLPKHPKHAFIQSLAIFRN